MANTSDNNTNNTSSSLVGYTSSFFNYIYQSFSSSTPTKTVSEGRDAKFNHSKTQIDQTPTKSSDTFNKYNPFGGDKKPVLVKTIQMTNSPSVIDRIGAEIESIRAYTRSSIDSISSFYKQVECTVGPYLTPVKRLGTIAGQALNSEAADKVKENIQLAILNGIENTIKTTRLSYELYNLEKSDDVGMKRFNEMKENAMIKSGNGKLGQYMEENNSASNVVNKSRSGNLMQNMEEIKSEKYQEKRSLEQRRHGDWGGNRGDRTHY